MSTSNTPISLPLDFESCMKVLYLEPLSDQDQALFLKVLQDHPEWLNQHDQRKKTLLMQASQYGSIEMVRILIQAGSDLNLQDPEGCTPLMMASDLGRTDVVQALIQAGADPNLQNNMGWTALMYASNLMYTSNQGHLITVKALIQAGADLNLQDQNGCTALMRASWAYPEVPEVVNVLIHMGADLNAQDQYGWTALMRAAYQGHFESVQALIQQGANPLLMNNDHQTAADLVQERGHQVMTGYLEAHLARQVLNHSITLRDEASSCGLSNDTDSLRASKGLRL